MKNKSQYLSIDVYTHTHNYNTDPSDLVLWWRVDLWILPLLFFLFLLLLFLLAAQAAVALGVAAW